MRDPLSWSFPIFRLFGITVRVHVLLIAVFLGLYLRVAMGKDATGRFLYDSGAGLDMLGFLGLLFVSVLLHEFGHCYGAYLVDGEANEILLWPLGGLAYTDVPHTPWANFVTTIMGPMVNVFLCLLAAVALASHSLLPSLNPLAWAKYYYLTPAYNWSLGHEMPVSALETWQLLAARIFYVNWILFLFNMVIVAYPMDAGRLLQEALWPRLGYHRATRIAVFVGFVFSILIGIYSLAENEVFALGLCMFIFISCKQQWILLETGGEDALFGYDFSQGYTSLEKDQPPPPKRKRPNFFQRWLQRRAQKKLQAELERHEADERRMDQLLEKIQREGRHSLTDEENRFLKRVADKYRNRP
jgi:Zn-dependent protease